MNEYEVGVAHRFAAFCKKTMKLSAYKWYAKRKKHEESEVSLSLVTEEYEMDFTDPTDYFKTAKTFVVQGMKAQLFDADLAEAVKHLQPDLRDVILLYYILGYNNEEVAIICKCTERTIIRRKEKALDRLREELREAYE